MNTEYLKKSIHDNELVQKKKQKKKHVDDAILNIVKNFIIDKKLICYGGTAINDILPREYQFYNYETDIPDYDFFSPNAMSDAKELCNIFSKQNVHSIESKSAFVNGTYKIFVNFVAVADITQIDETFYSYLLKANHHIKRDNVLYSPPSYLRMSLHQELARPLGDISRWDKIYSRLQLFNKYFSALSKNKRESYNSNDDKINLGEVGITDIYEQLFDFVKSNQLVFCNFDIVIQSLRKYMKVRRNKKDNFVDKFIVYTEDLNRTAKMLKSIPDIKIKRIKSIYKFVNDYIYLYYNGTVVGIIFATNSCLSYNIIKHRRKEIRVGNIDTLLNLYFTLTLIDVPINTKMVDEVIDRLQNIVVNYKEIINKFDSISNIPDKLKRFSLPCYGEQPDREDILKERSLKYKKLKNNRTSKEYKEWFFKYSPKIKSITTQKKKEKKKKSRKSKKN